MFDSNLIIKGGAFSEPTKLNGILGKRMNIVFGRNGSGKSTIARAFREQQADRLAMGLERKYELSSDGSGSLSQEVGEHLFVFNEDFIDKNVKVDNLKSIIRIGASAELDADIQALRETIKKKTEDKKAIDDELEILNGNKTGSIKEAEDELKNGLKKQGGFKTRLDKIEGRGHNLTATLINPILNFDSKDNPSISIGDMAKQLDESIDRYLSFESGETIAWNMPDLSHLPDINEVNTILGQTVRPAELTEEESRILEELSSQLADEDFISKTQSIIVESSRDFCPLCHQPVTSEHKHTLQQRLIKFRDKTVQEFKEKVNGINASVCVLDVMFPSFQTNEYDQDIRNAGSKIQELNNSILDIKTALESKASNPFSTMPAFNQDAFKTLTSECQTALSKIFDDVQTFNKSFEEKESLLKDIYYKNIQLAYHENKNLIDELKKLNDKKTELEELAQGLSKEISDKTTELHTISSKIDQVDDAREQINNYLDIIFGINKLHLAPAGKNLYKLQIKKNDSYEDIPPRAISSGERNALALAYFFACVLEKKEKNYNYSEPTLLIIDDPVSSFDAENKAGVISLLANQCKKIIAGNDESKVLILTHDYTTLRDMCTLRQNSIAKDDYEEEPNRYGSGTTNEWYYYLLSHTHKLKRQNCKHITGNLEYGSDLWNISFFAQMEDPDLYEGIDGIGNIIRKFAENYASHMYKCRWYDLFYNDAYSERIPANYMEKIRPFAIRNVLNSESHCNDDVFSPTEIQRSARIVLSYIFFDNPQHIHAYIRNEYRIELSTIINWLGL